MSKFMQKNLYIITTIMTILSIVAKPVNIQAFAVDNQVMQMEYLDRGTVAVKSGTNVYLSWRLLGTENYDTAFDVFRDGEKIATVTDSTNYTDLRVGTSYTVVPSGESVSSGKAVSVWDNQYMTIPLDRPEGGTSFDDETYTYSPNDITPADVDGDGEYELILKWEPSNSFDSGKDARHNGNVYIDCYKMNGTKLWRIDMGMNINAGAHFTQMAAYDFDLDGKAELALKTAPGTKDGKNNYVSEASSIEEIKNTDNSADYRHDKNGGDTGGRVLSGDEYYTVFQGDTGEALDTIYYPHSRGTITEWGDTWGNRSERYLAAVAYLDGQTPSMIAWRGYYGKTTATAYNLVEKKLIQIADFDTSVDGYSSYAGNGNHNLVVGDVDNDGCDEILCGSLCLDNDLTQLWCSGRGHGDALHLADYDPTHEGMEYFSVHEDYSGNAITGSTTGHNGEQRLGGMTLYAADTGEELFHKDDNADTGRGMIANVGYTNGYFEIWGAGNYASYGGNQISNTEKYYPDSTNFRIFWDGNMYDELLDGTSGSDEGGSLKISGKSGRIQTLNNVISNNGTKNNACLVADLFGDWREEIVARGQDNSSLLVYTTTIPTENKLYTLMHDRAYRMQVASQNAGYNQPPHISYYVSDDNNEYDMRKTAGYIKTVHNGQTELRTENKPNPIFKFKLDVTDNVVSILNKAKQQLSAVLYKVKYNEDKTIKNAEAVKVDINDDKYTTDVNVEDGDCIFLWDENMQPLAEKLTGKPTIAPSPTLLPMPTSTPTPTPMPTPTPTPDFVVEDGTLVGYNGTDTDVIVPETVDGQTITAIDFFAFNFNEDINSIILPDSITEIDPQAFAWCTNLKKVVLPKNLTEISGGLFRKCTSLEIIELPKTVTFIDAGAFEGCSGLKEITIPDGVEKIYDDTFDECTSLTKINLPASVTAIANGAFGSCTSLESIDLDNISSIDKYAFYNCTGLTELTIGENPITISAFAFEACSNITKVTVKNSETSLTDTGLEDLENLSIYGYIDSEAQFFADINDIPFYDLKTGERIINEWVVNKDGIVGRYNGDETDIVIPREVNGIAINRIGERAFANCKITSMEMEDNIQSVDDDAFIDCKSLKSVKLSKSMNSLYGCFLGCSSLEYISIPSNIKFIEPYIFSECKNVVIHCAEGSTAQEYAIKYNISYVIDENL